MMGADGPVRDRDAGRVGAGGAVPLARPGPGEAPGREGGGRGMARVLGVLRSGWVRSGFVVVALAGAAFALVQDWDRISHALRSLPLGYVLLAAVVNVVYLACTLASWRAVLSDLGSPLPPRAAFEVFFVSQLGKYVPGGVWHMVAVSELGHDRQVPRRRSVSAIAVATLVGIATGFVAAVPMLVLAGRAVPERGWLWLAVPVALLLLSPAVLNRLLALAMRVLRLEPPERPMTRRGTATAVAWALAGWGVVGAQVWLLGLGLGLARSSLLTVVGAYALAWVAGFLVVVAPAGLGPREVVLGVLLAGALPAGSAVALVLVTRVVQTVVDLAMAGAGYVLSRRTPASRSA
jgi:uncharacterized membrane protein YbhN (UPF0104 family)